MRRMLVLSLLVVGVAVALAVGSYSALAGSGPVAGVASAVIGADESDDGDVLNAIDADDVDGDDADNGEGAQNIAQLIADAFGDGLAGDGLAAEALDVSQGDVLALHEQGIGFGAIFKLYLLSAAGAGPVEALRSAAEGDGGYEFHFGELFKALSDDQTAVLDSGPKNLGQLVSAAHHEDNGGAGGATAQGGGQGHAFGRDHDQGKPQGVPPDDGDG